jgi:hypothetical protein
VEYWNQKTPGFEINESGRLAVEKWISDYSIQEVMPAMDTSARQYLKFGPDGVCLKETVERAFLKVPAICVVNVRAREQPSVRDLYLIRGLFRNRIPGYFDSATATQWLKSVLALGVPAEELRLLATGIRNWTQFRVGLEDLAERHRVLQEETPNPRRLVAAATSGTSVRNGMKSEIEPEFSDRASGGPARLL